MVTVGHQAVTRVATLLDSSLGRVPRADGGRAQAAPRAARPRAVRPEPHRHGRGRTGAAAGVTKCDGVDASQGRGRELNGVVQHRRGGPVLPRERCRATSSVSHAAAGGGRRQGSPRVVPCPSRVSEDSICQAHAPRLTAAGRDTRRTGSFSKLFLNLLRVRKRRPGSQEKSDNDAIVSSATVLGVSALAKQLRVRVTDPDTCVVSKALPHSPWTWLLESSNLPSTSDTSHQRVKPRVCGSKSPFGRVRLRGSPGVVLRGLWVKGLLQGIMHGRARLILNSATLPLPVVSVRACGSDPHTRGVRP
eukprot:1192479-Prorocentrum_minimum.AAC.3